MSIMNQTCEYSKNLSGTFLLIKKNFAVGRKAAGTRCQSAVFGAGRLWLRVVARDTLDSTLLLAQAMESQW